MSDDELDSTRPERRPPLESLLPARALPSLSGASSIVIAAAGAAATAPSITLRVVLMLACGVAAWFVGFFTPSPRRRYRRNDR